MAEQLTITNPAVAERDRLEAKLERIAERGDRIAVAQHKLADELLTLTGELTVAREEAFTADDEQAARARVTKLEKRRDALTRQISDAKADAEAAGKARRKVIREIEALLFDRAPEFIDWATQFSEAADEALAALEAPLAKVIAAWSAAESAWRQVSLAAGTGPVPGCPFNADLLGVRPIPTSVNKAGTGGVVIWQNRYGKTKTIAADDTKTNTRLAEIAGYWPVHGTPRLTESGQRFLAIKRNDPTMAKLIASTPIVVG